MHSVYVTIKIYKKALQLVLIIKHVYHIQLMFVLRPQVDFFCVYIMFTSPQSCVKSVLLLTRGHQERLNTFLREKGKDHTMDRLKVPHRVPLSLSHIHLDDLGLWVTENVQKQK